MKLYKDTTKILAGYVVEYYEQEPNEKHKTIAIAIDQGKEEANKKALKSLSTKKNSKKYNLIID